MFGRSFSIIFLAAVLLAAAAVPVLAEGEFGVDAGADLLNRYVWRGMDFGNAPSLQPAISCSYRGFELGVWGAYTLANQASDFDELDFWLGYGLELGGGSAVGLVVTDYYLPNAGIPMFNFNNYDGTNDLGEPKPGAHMVEAGVRYTAPETFPITVSGYMFVYNDEGNNVYLQLDYPFIVGDSGVSVFCGAAVGSEDNPAVYGADAFKVINIGVTVDRSIEMTESFSLPLTASFILNPAEEISYLVFGLSL